MSMKMFNADAGIIIRNVPDSNIIDHIPPAVYKLRENPMEGEIYLIKDRPKFNTPEKCYGTHNTNKAAILAAWKKNAGSTGVLLRGIKGAGKSVLAEDLGNSMLQLDIPVIMVDSEISRQALTLVTKMAGPCMVYFDEFGKVFSEKSRRDLLTYFSDSDFKKVLFVVTSNSKKELDKYMLDRPGRFLFRIDYKSLDPVAISEMLDDYGLNQEMITMMNAYVNSRQVTFDMLRFLAPIAAESESPMEFNHRIKILNCPAPVYQNFTIDKVLVAGEPFYGYTRQEVENGEYTLTLTVEGKGEPVYNGKFKLGNSGRYQVLSETSVTRKLQVFVDNVVVIGTEYYDNSIDALKNRQLLDPDAQKESSEAGKKGISMNMGMGGIDFDSMFRHHLTGRHQGGMSDEQKSLLEMAKFIVENHKKPETEAQAEGELSDA